MDVHEFPILAAVLTIAAIAAMFAVRLKQPLIVAFIGVGILVGPVGLGWVTTDGTMELLAHLGIAVLLFLVGLRLDLHLVKTTGPVALATGLGQVIFTSVVGYFIAIALGMDTVTALYVAVALTFSSTIIIVKLLSDKRELEQLHGRIAVGFLIVQDIIVVLVMIAITAFGQEAQDNVALGVVEVVAKGIGLLIGIVLLAKYVLPRVLHSVAQSQELLVLFGISYAVAVAAFSDWLGFSSEVGAFLAGVSLASTPYRDALGSRLVSLRDFLLLFFFLVLGAQLEFTDAGQQIKEALIFSAFVLFGNPLIVILIMALMRYPVRVGFLAGLTVAQISEFSLILAALGLSLGHITNATVSLITVVGLITIGGSTYLILYSHQIYAKIGRWLEILDRSSTRKVDLSDDQSDVDVIVYGLGRFGGPVADRLGANGWKVLAVDFDPRRISNNRRPGVTAIFGSAEDIQFLETLPLGRARAVVSTIPDIDANRALIVGLEHHSYTGCVAIVALNDHDAHELSLRNIDCVLEPYVIAADVSAERIEHIVRGPDSSFEHGPESHA
ncbi:cation:proton antiporter [Hoyosella rhizosphaerae]|uniref:Potassium efflux system protein n=1 Tax=Hoyosella rhizosphaerae TaxID=1755582 RepID=A0A916U0E0_9ACTN|nr:cation:proton antiporter [Hoyosella rhizosphaerae]MBN4927105.1 cation:proton antiporter [Hoyosella rhizosphaerae]GGC53975.1 potassium efflux system protein [Hoyosella rhizosphaerae]